jgi:hypothetical protein
MTDKVGQGSRSEANQTENQKQSSANAETEMPDWAKQWTEQQNAKIDEALGQARAAQSGRDKLQAQLNEAQSTFAKGFEAAKTFESSAEAERAFWIDEQMRQSREQAGGDNSNAQQNDKSLAGQSSGAGTVDPELLKTLGIDPQSPEYLEQVRLGNVGNVAALNILAARQTQNVEGSATGASGGAGGSTASTTTQQQVLRDQYNEELDAAQKLTGGVLKPNALYQIQQKYANLGLQDLI